MSIGEMEKAEVSQGESVKLLVSFVRPCARHDMPIRGIGPSE